MEKLFSHLIVRESGFLRKFVSISGENCIMEEVFAKIKNGDQGAFEQVFRMFYMPLCDYAVMILGDQAEAEDVVQDLSRISGKVGRRFGCRSP